MKLDIDELAKQIKEAKQKVEEQQIAPFRLVGVICIFSNENEKILAKVQKWEDDFYERHKKAISD